jgi:transcriptional regulator with XRE-family HTH domain
MRKRVISTPVKLARIKLGITQAELAERVSVSHNYMAALERAPQGMTDDVVARVAKALGITVAEIKG